MMEQAISSLEFKGSISEAIIEAKKQRKLFIVYISGEDGESILLEQSTLIDLNVEESISKYCIFLRISEGSIDASHFSAIYSHKSSPCITAIGYNGVQLWQQEGFISAVNLVSLIEKAWMTLHIQETTATVLTAALASKTSELSSSRASNDVLFEQGSSSTTDVPSSSTEKPLHDVETRPLVISELIRENRGSEPRVEINTKLSVEASSQSIQTKELGTSKDEHSATSTETTKKLPSPVMVDLDSSEVESKSFSVGDGCPAPEETINLKDHGSGISQGNSGIIACEDENVIEDKKADVLDNSTHVSTSNDVYLNIRLPDGASLQEKFSIRSTLRVVKDYVDRNQTSGIDSYDLAIPYPRKVFNEQDFSKELSELGLFNRQAMIVVPRHPASGFHRGRSLSHEHTISASDVDLSSASNGGYFGYLKRALSYMNPFYYLGSSASASSSEQEPKDGSWQYRPNPISQTERPFPSHSQNQSTSSTAGNASKSRKPTSHFGSNIHTLKHDEDEDQFKDRNAFWNGNSTQYGGSGGDDGK